MKKIALATILAATVSVANAAGYVNLDVEQVTDRATDAKSAVQYLRAGTQINGVNYGIQSRTSRDADRGGMYNSLEGYVGRTYGYVSPFVGVGYDNGHNGADHGQYTYGLIGAKSTVFVGPGALTAGVKTRVNWDSDNPRQTVVFAGYSVPVTKQVSLGVGVSHSSQDIKERGVNAGVTVAF